MVSRYKIDELPRRWVVTLKSLGIIICNIVKEVNRSKGGVCRISEFYNDSGFFNSPQPPRRLNKSTSRQNLAIQRLPIGDLIVAIVYLLISEIIREFTIDTTPWLIQRDSSCSFSSLQNSDQQEPKMLDSPL